MKLLNYYNPLSKSGRQLSRPPKATTKNQKEWDTWLLNEAKKEASRYEKKLLLPIETSLQIKRKVNKRSSPSILTAADYDTINLILFGDIDIKINYIK